MRNISTIRKADGTQVEISTLTRSEALEEMATILTEIRIIKRDIMIAAKAGNEIQRKTGDALYIKQSQVLLLEARLSRLRHAKQKGWERRFIDAVKHISPEIFEKARVTAGEKGARKDV